MLEFRPPVRRGVGRLVLGGLLPLLVIVPMVGLLPVVVGGSSGSTANLGPVRLGLGMLAVVALASAGALFAVTFFGPGAMRYRVGQGMLEVRTIFGRQRWPVRGALAKGYTPARLWRVAGTGLPGYHTGLYRESGTTTRVYATDLTRVILFEGPARVILSPEDRVEMLRALEAEGATVLERVP